MDDINDLSLLGNLEFDVQDSQGQHITVTGFDAGLVGRDGFEGEEAGA